MAAVFDKPLTIEQALRFLDGWLGFGSATIVQPGPRHLEILQRILQEVGARGNLVNDAHLAALAIEYKADLMSFDRDFAQFTGVRHRVPEPLG